MDIGSVNKIGNFVKSYFELGTTTNEIEEQGQDDVKCTGNEEAAKDYTEANIEKALNKINKLLKWEDAHLKFTMHEKLGKYYVQLVSDETNEVIREIPPKKILDVVADIEQRLGLIIDEKR